MKAFRPEITAFLAALTFSVLGCTVTIPIDTSGLDKGEDQTAEKPGPDEPVANPVPPKPTYPKDPGPEQLPIDPAAKEGEVALKNIVVKAGNGGINPKVKAYVIQGEVQLGGNACEAKARKASISAVQEDSVDGKTLVVAKVSGGLEGVACPAIFQPVFAKVSITVRGEGEFEGRVFVQHVEDLGQTRSLEEILSGPANCDDIPDICPANFDPVVCEVKGTGDEPIKFGNLCEAQAFLAKFICEKKLEAIDAKSVCKPAEAEE